MWMLRELAKAGKSCGRSAPMVVDIEPNRIIAMCELPSGAETQGSKDRRGFVVVSEFEIPLGFIHGRSREQARLALPFDSPA